MYGITIQNTQNIDLYANTEFVEKKSQADRIINILKVEFNFDSDDWDEINSNLKGAYKSAINDVRSTTIDEMYDEINTDMGSARNSMCPHSKNFDHAKYKAKNLTLSLMGCVVALAYKLQVLDVMSETLVENRTALQKYTNALNSVYGWWIPKENDYNKEKEKGWLYNGDTTKVPTWLYGRHYSFNLSDEDRIAVAKHGVCTIKYQNKDWMLSEVEVVDATDDKFWSDTPDATVLKVTGHYRRLNFPGLFRETQAERARIATEEWVLTQTFYVAYEGDIEDNPSVAAGKDVAWVLRNLRRKQRGNMFDALGI